MGSGDADKRVEKPEPNRKDSGGTATNTDEVRQAPTARDEQVGIEEGSQLETVLERENVLAAYRRVKANGGAAGIDGMTVEDLMPYCQKHWAASPSGTARRDVPSPTGEESRYSETGRRDTDVGHPDRDGPDDPTGFASGSATFVGSDVFGK